MSISPSAQVNLENRSPTELEQHWLGHYRRWQQSGGMSLAGYARSQGLVVNTFYGWHLRLKRRGLAKPEPSSTVFHRVTVEPTEAPSLPTAQQTSLSSTDKPAAAGTQANESSGLSFRFILPNGIEGELTGLSPGHCTGFLEALARLRV
jgi:hypothetical protein